MQINSIDGAIQLTMQKYRYPETMREQIYRELDKGDFSCITRQSGAREFVKKNYRRQYQPITQPNKPVSPFEDFTTLTHFFDEILNMYNIPSKDPNYYTKLYQEMQNYVNGKDKEKIEKLMVEAATLYHKEIRENVQVLRPTDFSTPDLTRSEATRLTSIFGNMENQKHQVTEALEKNPGYQRALLTNLIKYAYYEHDYSISLEDLIRKGQDSYGPIPNIRK